MPFKFKELNYHCTVIVLAGIDLSVVGTDNVRIPFSDLAVINSASVFSGSVQDLVNDFVANEVFVSSVVL